MKLAITKDKVITALRDCYDPCCRDQGISVVDMGLIEDVRVNGKNVDIDIVLTSGWCPSVSILHEMMKERVGQCDGVDKVEVKVVWDPAWTMERLSDSARAKLTLPMDELIPYREKRLAAQKGG